MQFVGMTCLVGLTAMTMFRTHALDRQIDTMKRQRGGVPATGGLSMTDRLAADRAIHRAQGQRVAVLSSIVAAFILLGIGCRGIDDLAGWMTDPGVLRDTLVLSLLLMFGFATSLPNRYYSGPSSTGRTSDTGAGAKSYLFNQARILCIGVVLGVPLLWGLFSVAHAARGPWWLYLWGALVIALVLEPVVCGRVIIPGISVMMPVRRGVDDQITALMKQLGFKSTGVFEWAPAAWAGKMGILVLGFGSSRRVVIPANLLRTLHGDEIAAVVAHDLGHGRAGHGPLHLTGRAVKLFVILGVFAWFTSSSRVLPGFDRTASTQAFSFLAALLLLDVSLKLLTLVEHVVERHFEFRADSFVNGLLGPEALTRALLKLSEDGQALTPDPLYSLINDHVPPAALRISRLLETAPILMPIEQAEEALPVIEQLAWIGRDGLLTFSGHDAIRDLVSAAEPPSRPADCAAPKKKRQRRNPAAGPKRVRATFSMG